ncbi:MAG: hypothetical protein LBH00_01375 [Planctomycetaceae bacterium]|nr:hypothetical protein [Planctomycetaceae bacterium]
MTVNEQAGICPPFSFGREVQVFSLKLSARLPGREGVPAFCVFGRPVYLAAFLPAAIQLPL